MSVSGELLCSFELLKPLDSSALKSHIKKSRNKRQSMLNSPVRATHNGFLGVCPSRAIYNIFCTLTDFAFSLLITLPRVTNSLFSVGC
jgi:serine/threonine-protein phosphatase PP1 catalytic subunit